MKILIAGSDLNAKLTAKYLKIEDESNDIYITTQDSSEKEFYTAVNIRENDIESIRDFVKYNSIEFTIVTSQLAIINGIADEFKKEGFLIFAPYSESEKITCFNSIAKKIMYKLRINTPKFGIFDRENLAIDYIRKAKFPIIVENDFTLTGREMTKYNSFSKAKTGIQKLFENNNEKIVIENYIDEEPIFLYFITDGYNARPLINLSKTEENGLTSIISPTSKISEEIILYILKKIIYPLLDDIAKFSDMYTGILGLKIKIHNGTIYVLEFYNGFQEYDMQVFLSLLNDKLLNILLSAANSSLSDEYDYINMYNYYSYTIAVNKSKFQNIDDSDEDFFESEDEKNYIYTSTASTLNNAKAKLYNHLNIEENKEIRI